MMSSFNVVVCLSPNERDWQSNDNARSTFWGENKVLDLNLYQVEIPLREIEIDSSDDSVDDLLKLLESDLVL